MIKYYTVNELSKILNVDPQWVRKRVKDKEIPFYRIGRRINFKKDEIDEWMEKRKIN